MPISYQALRPISLHMPAHPLLMDAVRVDTLQELVPEELLPYVLYNPWSCPGWCEQNFALLINKPVELEITRGLLGRDHLKVLQIHMERLCTEETPCTHVRTDGVLAWSLR